MPSTFLQLQAHISWNAFSRNTFRTEYSMLLLASKSYFEAWVTASLPSASMKAIRRRPTISVPRTLFAFFKEGAEMRLHIRYRCNFHSLISFADNQTIPYLFSNAGYGFHRFHVYIVKTLNLLSGPNRSSHSASNVTCRFNGFYFGFLYPDHTANSFRCFTNKRIKFSVNPSRCNFVIGAYVRVYFCFWSS